MSDTSRTRFEPAQDLKVTDRNLKNENNFNCSLQRRILTAFLGRSAVCSETWLKGKWSHEILALIYHVRDQNHVRVFFELIQGFISSDPRINHVLAAVAKKQKNFEKIFVLNRVPERTQRANSRWQQLNYLKKFLNNFDIIHFRIGITFRLNCYLQPNQVLWN